MIQILEIRLTISFVNKPFVMKLLELLNEAINNFLFSHGET